MKKVILAFYIIFFTSSVFAFSWQDLWSRPDQQAAKALLQGKPKQAAKLFSKPNWQGVAHYRAGNYKNALSQFKQGTTSDSYYNQGNALAKMQQYQAAIKAYHQAIKLDPNNKDAIYNRDLIKKLLKKQSSQSQPQQKNKQNDQGKSSNQQSNQSKANNQPQQKQSGEENKKQQAQKSNQPQQQTNNQNAKQQEEQNKQQQLNSKKQQQKNNQAKQQEKMTAKAAKVTQQTSQEKEKQQTDKQWMRRVPDEPGVLLKQIFSRDYLRKKRS